MVKHNNQLPNVHLRKHWQRFVKSWFNQPARKQRRSQARQEKAARLFPRPLERLRPIVHSLTRKYNSKLRYGRGFTLQELKQAKVSPRFAQTVGISVDHRRQNTSEEALQMNVQRIESYNYCKYLLYKSKLILFPRRADKPKKGDIHDATADKLKSAESAKQNLHKHVIAKPTKKVREAFQKITQEQKDLRVFRKIRQVQVNQKYRGQREKRARELAEKEAEAKK